MKTILLTLAAIGIMLGLSAAEDRDRENPRDPSKYTREHRLVFYAVLEGLFEDGVSGEALELIIPDADGMIIWDQPEKTNFVYSCPLCTPAFDALRLYKHRAPFYAQKATRYNTFGAGVADEVLARLKGSPQERRDAIQEMIRDWVDRRLNAMALTNGERAAIEEKLEEMKKKGEEFVKSFQEGGHGGSFDEVYKDWKKCPVCEGSAAAGEE